MTSEFKRSNDIADSGGKPRESFVCSLFLLSILQWQLPAHQLTETKPRGLFSMYYKFWSKTQNTFVTFPSLYSPWSLHHSIPRLLISLHSFSHLSPLGLISTVFGEEMAQDVCAAAGYVNQRTLLPQTEARRDGQYQCDGLNDQSPLTQVPTDYKATQNGLNLQELMIGYKELQISFHFPELRSSYSSLNQFFLAYEQVLMDRFKNSQ